MPYDGILFPIILSYDSSKIDSRVSHGNGGSTAIITNQVAQPGLRAQQEVIS